MTLKVLDGLGAPRDLVSREASSEHILKHDVGLIDQPSALVHNKKTVATAGSAEALVASTTPITSLVIIKALVDNSGVVYVGGASVSAANGHALAAGEEVPITIDDLNKIYLDVSQNGDGVTYIGS